MTATFFHFLWGVLIKNMPNKTGIFYATTAVVVIFCFDLFFFTVIQFEITVGGIFFLPNTHHSFSSIIKAILNFAFVFYADDICLAYRKCTRICFKTIIIVLSRKKESRMYCSNLF